VEAINEDLLSHLPLQNCPFSGISEKCCGIRHWKFPKITIGIFNELKAPVALRILIFGNF